MERESAGAADFERRDEFGNAEANLQFLHEALTQPYGRHVLEIGSGRGAMLRHLQQLGCNASGVEVDDAMIAESRRSCGDQAVTKVNGTTLPFPDSSFDIVLSFDVFEHIRDSDAHLHEVRRVLVPRGRYLFQTPNRWTNTVFESIRWRSFTAWRQDHCSLHSYRQIRQRLERLGFDVRFHDVPVVTGFFRRKLRHYLGAGAPLLLAIANPDRLPPRFRTNFFVEATKRS
jgi:ubiquinone/menaquinone biosynthesis C-methylase UbiE